MANSNDVLEPAGEYVAAEKIEAAYKKNRLVEQIWVYGNSLESTLVAVVVPTGSQHLLLSMYCVPETRSHVCIHLCVWGLVSLSGCLCTGLRGYLRLSVGVSLRGSSLCVCLCASLCESLCTGLGAWGGVCLSGHVLAGVAL